MRRNSVHLSMMSYFQRLLGVILLWYLVALSVSVTAQVPRPVYYVTVEHGLTEPAAGLVRRALRAAEAADATALIIELRGAGSLRTAWPLAREVANADVPVVAYIAPRGAQSGPVGTLLISAAHVAAMAPGTSVGFEAPLVDMPAHFSAATQQLLVDDAVKQLTSWARARERNAEWVEQAARNGAIIDAERAQQDTPSVIDLVAAEDELLTSLQGRQVSLADGTQRSIGTLGARVVRVAPTAWEQLLQLLAVPTVAFLLFVVGGIAIYLEFATPGIGVPGVTGALLVFAALGGFMLGEVRPLAVLLLAGGLVLVGLEHVVMSHGGLTVAGLVLLVLGALYLVDPARSPGLDVSYLAIGAVAVMLGTAALALVTIAMRVRANGPVTGQEALIGQIAEVRRVIAPEGMVFVNGALWSAWSDQGPFGIGEFVRIAGVEGLRLYVQRFEAE